MGRSRVRPEAGFAGREAKPLMRCRARKEGARGGTTGSPTLVNDPEFALAMANRLHELIGARS